MGRRFFVSVNSFHARHVREPMEEQSPRLTRHLSAVYHWEENLFVPGCCRVYRRLFVSVKPFHARHVREAEQTREILCKLMEEHNDRLTTGWQPVDNRLISSLSPGREALFVPGCWPMGPSPYCPCKPFSCKACPRACLLLLKESWIVWAKLVESQSLIYQDRVGSSGARWEGKPGRTERRQNGSPRRTFL